MSNALSSAVSPYLRQHAHQPVDWCEWSQAAFEEAQARGVPVIISIGYATCHWCHVMAHESFDHPDIAAFMNAHFVCIKVDREERPDVDAIYMDTVQAIHGHGGWPLNAFSDAKGRPFFAGTYYPPNRWMELLRYFSQLYRDNPSKLEASAAELYDYLRQQGEGAPVVVQPWQHLQGRLLTHLGQRFDEEHPGFGHQPKFPPSQMLRLLLEDGSEEALEMAVSILEAMQDSGLHDRVGGGFHRYATDAEWRIPHFEKMLYDNAQLAVAYTWAALKTQRSDFRQTALNIGHYLLRDMRVYDEAGTFLGYASAEDADDPGGEGSFYAWSPEALHAALPHLDQHTLAQLIEAWDVSEGEAHLGASGHLEPITQHIPHPRRHDLDSLALRFGFEDALALRASWEAYLPYLRQARQSRPRPIRDDKVLTDLNGLTLEAFAALSRLDTRFCTPLEELAACMRARLLPSGDVIRLEQGARAGSKRGYITDYGLLAAGLWATFERLGQANDLEALIALLEAAFARFQHPEGGLYTTQAGAESDDMPLLRRSREDSDGPYPAGAHALAWVLARVAPLLEDDTWSKRTDQLLESHGRLLEAAPSAVPTLLRAALARSQALVTLVLSGPEAKAWRDSLLSYVSSDVIFIHAEAAPSWLPSVQGRLGQTKTTAWLCVGQRCLLPAFTLEEVRHALAQEGRVCKSAKHLPSS